MNQIITKTLDELIAKLLEFQKQGKGHYKVVNKEFYYDEDLCRLAMEIRDSKEEICFDYPAF